MTDIFDDIFGSEPKKEEPKDLFDELFGVKEEVPKYKCTDVSETKCLDEILHPWRWGYHLLH